MVARIFFDAEKFLRNHKTSFGFVVDILLFCCSHLPVIGLPGPDNREPKRGSLFTFSLVIVIAIIKRIKKAKGESSVRSTPESQIMWPNTIYMLPAHSRKCC